MDPASIIAFISFAGSTCNTIAQVYALLQNLKDAPEHIRRLETQLGITQEIVLSFSKDAEDVWGARAVPLPARQAIEIVEKYARDLQTALKPLMKDKSGPERLLNRIKAVLKKGSFLASLAELDRAKDDLQSFRLRLMSEQNAQHTEMLMQIKAVVNQLHHKYDGQIKSTTGLVESTAIIHETLEHVQLDFSQLKTISESLTKTIKHVDKDFESGMIKPFLTEVLREVFAENRQLLKEEKITHQHSTQQVLPTNSNRPSLETAVVSQEVISNADCVPFYILRSRSGATLYHNPLLGTVSVLRKFTTKRKWDETQKQYESHRQIWQTELHFRPASWMSTAEYILKYQHLVALSGSGSLRVTLEPIRYIHFPKKLVSAVHYGELSMIQQHMAENFISLRDRDITSNYNLLELSLEEIGYRDWMNDSPLGVREKKVGSTKTAKWLLARGASTEIAEETALVRDFHYTTEFEASPDYMYSLGQVLVESTANVTSLLRAQVLMFFATYHHAHPRSIDFLISDLIDEITNDEPSLESLEAGEREYWVSKNKIVPGLECVILNSILRLVMANKMAGTVPMSAETRMDILKSPRKMIAEMLLATKRGDHRTDDRKDMALFLTSIIRQCKPLRILEDGFAEHMTILAHRLQISEVWYRVLNWLDFPPTSPMEPANPPLDVFVTGMDQARVMLGAWNHFDTRLEDDKTAWMNLFSIGTPHYRSDRASKLPDICLLKETHSELHFDCGITDPGFSHSDEWQNEQKFWTKFESEHEKYCSLPIVVDRSVTTVRDVNPTAQNGPTLLSRLVGDAITLVSSIV